MSRLLVASCLLVAGDFVLGLRPEHAMTETEIKSHDADQDKAVEKVKLNCCFDSTAHRNGCFSDDCFVPKKEGWACPSQCASFLEGSSATAETETKTSDPVKDVCCGRKTLSGAMGNNFCSTKNDCFTEPTSQPCPMECKTNKFRQR
ncbi:unnamed protein product [Symbiodinium sp. CCMP2592]|nr:unnamed protein product [Symbiodinium sp. CCMP2592]CAE7224408.1 unnamed protein product [Symbiodinium sp. CCMP2592]CAE7224412.1 unnamed protein product [Symbiodinium sp. CCMP2592]